MAEMTYVNRLEEFRKHIGCSVKEFAEVLGVHRSSVYRYQGSNKHEPREISLETAAKLTDRFGVSLDWLFGLSDVMYIDSTRGKITEVYNSLSQDRKKEFEKFVEYLLYKE